MDIKVLRAEQEWQRAGAYSVRIEGMNRQHHIPLREEFDEHDGDGTRYIVLLDDGYPVATCRFYNNKNGNATLGRLVVLPEYRGQGLGRMAVEEAEKWIAELGYPAVDIDSRTNTVEFYEKLGYQKAGEEVSCSGCFECIQMHKEIAPRKTDNGTDVSSAERTINECGTLDIESDRLLMRKFSYDDIDSMMRNWVADEDVQGKYGEPAYKTREAVRGLLDKYIGGYESGTYFRWAIIEKASGECIGQIAFFLVDKKNHFAEIEYCIGTGFQRRGYATEANRAVTKFGLEKIGLHKVQICCRPANVPSHRVIEKSGFTYEGTLRDYFRREGRYESRMYFSIIEGEKEL